jgi:mevalonate kinase
MQQYYSNGKLLITGEYLILDGAKGLALPTKFGQDLSVKKINYPELAWESIDKNNTTWFSIKFQLPDLTIENLNEESQISLTLQKILREAQKLNPKFLNKNTGYQVKTKLTFQRNWGLGSSSTLINNVAQWADVNAFDLLKNSFDGSGYDIACAQNKSPILYQLQDNKPVIETIKFNPKYKDQLYFVYLNKKQNSNEGIKKYKEYIGNISAIAEEISQITNEILHCKALLDFENILMEHEKIISAVVQQKPIQEVLFSDYFGQIKSLGAWGGDFILATGNDETPKYFKNKGFRTIITYQNMIL